MGRRVRTNRLLACVACTALTSLIAIRIACADATAYQNDPAHDGSVVMSNFNPIPTVLWTVNTGQGIAYPLIVGNQVIVNGSNQLQSYNAANGSMNWSVSAAPASTFLGATGPSYDNGMIFSNGPSTGMSAYSISNGQKVWSAPLPGQVTYTSPVTASNGTAYTAASGEGGTVYSVREADGQLQWTAGVENGFNSAPTVTGDGVYVSYVGPQSYKFGVSGGGTIWHFSSAVDGASGQTSVYYNNQLYVSQNFSTPAPSNQLVALNAGNGAKVFDTISGALLAPVSPPAFSNGFGYVALNNQLTEFSSIDGSILWSKSLDGNQLGAPLVINGYVYEETSGGNLFVLNGTNGVVVDELYLGSSAPTVILPSYSFFEGMAASDGILAVPDGQNLIVLSVPEPTCAFALSLAAGLVLGCRRARPRRQTS